MAGGRYCRCCRFFAALAGGRSDDTIALVARDELVAGCIAMIFQRQGAFAAFLTAAIIFTFSFLIRYIPTIVKIDRRRLNLVVEETPASHMGISGVPRDIV